MKKFTRSSRWARWVVWLGLIALLLTWLVAPKRALAHPADVYLQATYITVKPKQIVVELKLSPAVLVAPEVLTSLDADGNAQIEESEWQTYVEQVVPQLVLQVDGQPLQLSVTKLATAPYLNIQAGYGEIRITTAANLANVADDLTTGTHTIAYKNNFAPTGVAYQVNALVEQSAAGAGAITLGKQNRDDLQQGLTVDYTIAPVAAAPTAATTAALASFTLPEDSAGQGEQLLAYLYEPTRSPWALLFGLALAVVLGGLHALTPGHGKTLVAAYLVGSRGTIRHAIALGGIVTFTHTASVIVIGLLALFASQSIVPSVLTPILQTLSGLLVVYLGVRLVWQRWLIWRGGQGVGPGLEHQHAHDHDHVHDHDHGHDHAHSHVHSHAHEMAAESDHSQAFTHQHGDGHVHTHLFPDDGLTLRNLLAMGVSGGLVPCPEALGIMVIAIGLNRILLGLGLIVSFSLGLAAVLIAIGILLVRSRLLVERWGGSSGRLSSALPLVSAVIVTVLGIGLTLGGLAPYLS